MLTARSTPNEPEIRHFIWSGPNKENPVEIAVYDGREKTLAVNAACLFNGEPSLPMEERMERSDYANAWQMLSEVFPDVFANPPVERAFQTIEGGF